MLTSYVSLAVERLLYDGMYQAPLLLRITQRTNPTKLLLKSERIHPLHRIRRVLERVQSTQQPNRVFTDEPPARRIIVPMPIVMQPRLFIEVLPLEHSP